MAPTRPGVAQMLGRAARLRCPYCGRGRMFRGWFTLHAVCAVCGLKFERDEREDYWLGAYVLNFIVTETVFGLSLLAVVIATWPDTPWSSITWGGVAQMVLTPVVFYPFSRALWLALDLSFRPPGDADFETTTP